MHGSWRRTKTITSFDIRVKIVLLKTWQKCSLSVLYHVRIEIFFLNWDLSLINGWSCRTNAIINSLRLRRRELIFRNLPSSTMPIYLHSPTISLDEPFFGPTKLIHPWTTIVHATLRVSAVIDKCNSWLADVTLDWRLLKVHVITKHVGL